jgi:hypothetical protein
LCSFLNGDPKSSLYANYDGQVWGGGYANAVIGGVRINW